MRRTFALRRSAGSAFSLVEMLIAVGAVALISVGLAKLFSSVGKTVSVGKKVSYLNEVGAMMERQIRTDLAALTRDGFLVIRHQEIQPPTGASFQLNEDDASPRPGGRRLDSLVFFSTGKFSTNREAQWPGRQAVSNTARIYYGHGMKLNPQDYANLPLDDSRAVTSPWATQFGRTGPNQFAAEWTLLRHTTVLARPSMTEKTVPAGVPGYLAGPAWLDSQVQIALQPAAASIFRYDPLLRTSLVEPRHDANGGGTEIWGPTSNTRVNPVLPTAWARQGQSPVWPKFTSGMVDVASMDLSQVRNRILAAPSPLPDERSDPSRFSSSTVTIQPSANGDEDISLISPGRYRGSAHAMKLLMASAMPSDCPFMLPGATPDTPRVASGGTNADELRMLYAPTPPDFTGNLSGTGRWPVDQPYRQQDQAMLSASNFVTGCTEFVVEWSFGDVYPIESGNANLNDPRLGKLIWHGLPRWDDVNGDGNINTGETVFAAPYRNADFTGAGSWDSAVGYDRYNERVSSTLIRNVRSALIHWPTYVASNDERGQPSTLPPDGTPLYSFFGYVDPTYKRPTTNVQDQINWPWPKLLRFTITIVDPSDPTAEQTFQFVVDVPDQTNR